MQYCRIHLLFLHLHSREASLGGCCCASLALAAPATPWLLATVPSLPVLPPSLPGVGADDSLRLMTSSSPTPPPLRVLCWLSISHLLEGLSDPLACLVLCGVTGTEGGCLGCCCCCGSSLRLGGSLLGRDEGSLEAELVLAGLPSEDTRMDEAFEPLPGVREMPKEPKVPTMMGELALEFVAVMLLMSLASSCVLSSSSSSSSSLTISQLLDSLPSLSHSSPPFFRFLIGLSAPSPPLSSNSSKS
mmetsp:Transcript_7330/g.17919  ORF Transcript_7330/g.17919 Transcript_7330/m.17919 type:complete len:245 (-) Transcript_7330:378-1112(-)